MKILLVVHRFNPDFGGVEVTAELIARGLVERHGHEVTIVTHTRETNRDETFPFKILREPSRRKLIEAHKWADVVMHNNPCLRFAWPLAMVRRPWLIALRSWITLPGEALTPIQSMKYELKYGVVERADKLVSNSRALAGHVRPPVEVIHNSYRDKIFYDKGETRERQGIAYLGRLSADKGIDLLIEAVARLKAAGHKPKLTLIGGGDQLDVIESQIARLGLSQDVYLAGQRKGLEINDLLNRNTIAVVPSRIPEPFGTVTIENAAAGCATLVANHGGLPEAIGSAGLLFTPNDVDDLTAQLERLFTDDDLVAHLREASKEHVVHYRQHVMIDKFESALRQTVDIFESKKRKSVDADESPEKVDA
ncbi:glycosyltransferase family 4 protein [Falsarthrobacter nasiphocae]|uniref:Glycosyltransferase involved in cell wall biosynthesis n=1 Tax=Falsarthrobacter nasiphocae TaxID=189863 RepID=A0AAE3YE92_9MICC|nr:glycosyltransferase family 4 protein [Falsarthrobacter nasiphocae]MDR6891600.1 glycosyltransferase involved in cell wall biosynthesis [Falsarthrobacter nasiphocae]